MELLFYVKFIIYAFGKFDEILYEMAASVILFIILTFFLTENSQYFLQKTFFPSRSKFFPFRAGIILEGLHHPGKHTGNYKSCFPLIIKWRKNIGVYLDILEQF